MKKSLISLLIGLTVVSSYNLNAAEEKEEEQRWFEVEVILFERNVNTTNIKEHWDEALHPTFSSDNLDPMALFLDKDNLTELTEDAEIALLEGESLAQSVDYPQAGLIDDTAELPDFGVQEDTAPTSLLNKPVIKPVDIVKSTVITIDGASLKPEAQYPEFKIVPASELQLTEQFAALDKHANYNVLLHSAWRMVPSARKNAIPIRLFAGQNFQQQYTINGSALPHPVKTNYVQPVIEADVVDLDGVDLIEEGILTQPKIQSPDPITTDVDGQLIAPQKVPPTQTAFTSPVWQLDGELTIYLEHYLYAKTDLFIRKEGSKVIRSASATVPKTVSDEATIKIEDVDLLALSGIHVQPDTAAENKLPHTVSILDELNTIQNESNKPMVDRQLPREHTVPFLHSYPMQQLRVIRSGEIHYLDHPMFGMIIQIRKYDLPEVNAETEANTIEIMQ